MGKIHSPQAFEGIVDLVNIQRNGGRDNITYQTTKYCKNYTLECAAMLAFRATLMQSLSWSVSLQARDKSANICLHVFLLPLSYPLHS